MWSKALIWRYSLFQLPGIAVVIIILVLIQRWIDLSHWLVWGLVTLWIIKDIVLFPLVWRAYDWEGAKKANSMVGLEGVAKESLAPRGYIQIRNERWLAEVIDGTEIGAGQRVRVVEMRGLWLAVEREAEN